MAENQERKILIDLQLQDRDFEQELNKNNKIILENQQSIKKLTKEYKEGKVSIDAYVKQKGELQRENKKLSAQNRDIIKDQNTEANSLNALRRQLAKLTADRNSLDTSLEGNTEKFQDLQDEILQTTQRIKGFEEAGGDFRRNVGNYTGSIQEAIGASGSFGQGIVGLGGQVQGFFTILKANPIGLVIAAFTALAGLFAKSAKATKFLEDASAGLSAVMSVLVDRAEILFESFKLLFQLKFKEAFDKAKEAASGLADEIGREASEAVRLSDALRRVEQDLALIGIRRRESIRDQEKLKNERDNELLSIQDRIEANEKLFEIESKFNEEAFEAAEKRVAIITQQLNARRQEGESINELIKRLGLQDDAVQKLIEARTELADIEEESTGRENEFITNKTSLIREQADAQLRLLEARTANEIAILEDGNQRKLDLELQLIERRRALLIQAAGEDATILAAINQEAENERLEKFREFQAAQVGIESATSKTIEGITEEGVQNSLDAVGKKIKADQKAELEKQKNAEQTAAIKAQIEQQILGNTLAILGSIDESGKASALLQIGINAAQGISGAIAVGAKAGPFPANLGAITAGVTSVLAGIAQARQVFKQSAGSGGGSSLVGAGGGSNRGLVSQDAGGFGIINAGLLSQFSQPLQSEQRTAQSTADAVQGLGPIFVAVTDINKGQNKLKAKVTEASLG